MEMEVILLFAASMLARVCAEATSRLCAVMDSSFKVQECIMASQSLPSS